MRARLARTTTTLPDGTKVTRAALKPAPELEWRLQAAAVRALRNHPEYNRRFAIAGDMNSARRGPKAQLQAKATGLEPGEADLRVYLAGGTLNMIEYKAARGRLSSAQVARHKLLRHLGFTIETLQASTEEEAARETLALVNGWLDAAANDNKPWEKVG